MCAQKQSYLFKKIEGFTFTDDKSSDNEFDLEDLDEKSNVISFVNGIKEQADCLINKCSATTRYNAFYCPDLVCHLVKLAKHFPIWTNVMTKYFPLPSNVATSSRCEAYFKGLKHSDMGSNYAPIRVDKFVARHIDSIESISKFEYAAIKRKNELNSLMQDEKNHIGNKRKVDPNMSAFGTSDGSYLKEEENWKGLNSEASKKLKISEDIEIVANSIALSKACPVTIDRKPLEEHKINCSRGKF